MSKYYFTTAQKNADNQAYYKERALYFRSRHSELAAASTGTVDEYKRMRVNYDLFNNKCDLQELADVCYPAGKEQGELPARMANRDIISGRLKYIFGLESKRPFNYSALAVNQEATTRKEEKETELLQQYVVSNITAPIRKDIERKRREEIQGRELTAEELQALNAEIDAEVAQQSPESIKKYMERKHQDPSEVLSNHILNYFKEKLELKRKFSTKFKHGMISAKAPLYLGILNGELVCFNVNPLRFNCDVSPEIDFIERGQYASYEYIWTPSQIIKYFGKTISEADVKRIYDSWRGNSESGVDYEDLFALSERQDMASYDRLIREYGISVMHCTWKAPEKLGFLTYTDSNGNRKVTKVIDGYKLNKEAGDVKIEWEWIDRVHESWYVNIGDPIWLKQGPVEGQSSMANLPYYGVIYDNMNSEPTSLVDRGKEDQLLYNIVNYRAQLLMSSDKGKKILMNIGNVPTSNGLTLEQWKYFFEASPYVFYDQDEEAPAVDASNAAKVLDLSLVSDIMKYYEYAEGIKRNIGISMGIPDEVLGQIAQNAAVGNSQQNLIQSSYILEPYFDLENYSKKNILQDLIDLVKTAYHGHPKETWSYTMDDMSLAMFEFDVTLLDNAEIGIFISDSGKEDFLKSNVQQLAFAAMQNQTVDFSAILSILRQDNSIEAEEVLKVAEKDKQQIDAQRAEQERKAAVELETIKESNEQKKRDHEINKIRVKGEEDRKTVMISGSLTGMSFNPDADGDGDGTNDFFEIAKHGLNAEIAREEIRLKDKEINHKIENDRETLSLKKKELAKK